MTYMITFLEGIITFVSPCLLPLLPVYVAYFAGGVPTNTPAAHNTSTGLKRTIISALGFVIGFSLLFTLMGAFAGTVGSFFSQNQRILNIVCGIIVIFFGLHFAGILTIPALQKTLRPRASKAPRGFFTSLLFGMIFAIGWTPCVGAFLGSALALAASAGSTLRGISLLLSYSVGLAIPFLLAAVLIDQMEQAFTWIKQHYKLVNAASGILLIVVGLLMATGHMSAWLSLLAG